MPLPRVIICRGCQVSCLLMLLMLLLLLLMLGPSETRAQLLVGLLLLRDCCCWIASVQQDALELLRGVVIGAQVRQLMIVHLLLAMIDSVRLFKLLVLVELWL